MGELQLVNQYEPETDFVIDDILNDDKEIVIDKNDPEVQFSKFLYAIRYIENEMDKMKLNAEKMIVMLRQEISSENYLTNKQWLIEKVIELSQQG